MDLLAAITTRSSAGRLTQPGPTPDHLAVLLDAAARAPDHGRLKPWRFIVLDNDLKDKFSMAAAGAKRAKIPDMSAEQFAAERDKVNRSPLVVIIACTPRREQVKIPEIEQVMATAAAAQNFFLAAYDLGYGVMWKTGAAAYDVGVKAALGLEAGDYIVGIMHVGTRVK